MDDILDRFINEEEYSNLQKSDTKLKIRADFSDCKHINSDSIIKIKLHEKQKF